MYLPKKLFNFTLATLITLSPVLTNCAPRTSQTPPSNQPAEVELYDQVEPEAPLPTVTPYQPPTTTPKPTAIPTQTPVTWPSIDAYVNDTPLQTLHDSLDNKYMIADDIHLEDLLKLQWSGEQPDSILLYDADGNQIMEYQQSDIQTNGQSHSLSVPVRRILYEEGLGNHLEETVSVDMVLRGEQKSVGEVVVSRHTYGDDLDTLVSAYQEPFQSLVGWQLDRETMQLHVYGDIMLDFIEDREDHIQFSHPALETPLTWEQYENGELHDFVTAAMPSDTSISMDWVNDDGSAVSLGEIEHPYYVQYWKGPNNIMIIAGEDPMGDGSAVEPYVETLLRQMEYIDETYPNFMTWLGYNTQTQTYSNMYVALKNNKFHELPEGIPPQFDDRIGGYPASGYNPIFPEVIYADAFNDFPTNHAGIVLDASQIYDNRSFGWIFINEAAHRFSYNLPPEKQELWSMAEKFHEKWVDEWESGNIRHPTWEGTPDLLNSAGELYSAVACAYMAKEKDAWDFPESRGHLEHALNLEVEGITYGEWLENFLRAEWVPQYIE